MESLEQYIEEQRKAFKVKGIGVAVVKEGEVLLSKGFGDRDAERIFAIKGQPATTLEFVLADDGSVEKVVIPGAVFTPTPAE